MRYLGIVEWCLDADADEWYIGTVVQNGRKMQMGTSTNSCFFVDYEEEVDAEFDLDEFLLRAEEKMQAEYYEEVRANEIIAVC